MRTPTQPDLFGDARLPRRFWEKIHRAESGCWEWIASQTPNGYGTFAHDGTGQVAHRVAYAALVGAIPVGLSLDHLCRVRNCVNPDHLEPVTARENNLRSDSPTARNAAKVYCHRGHLLDASNMVAAVVPKGWRNCATCGRENSRIQKEAIRAAREALGLTRVAYIARYGWSASVAQALTQGVR